MKKTQTHFNRSPTFHFPLPAVKLSKIYLIHSGFQKVAFLIVAYMVCILTDQLEESIINNKIEYDF